MVVLDLYVKGSPCAACTYIKEMVREHRLPVNFKVDAYHPLANKHPTLILDNASAIVGAVSIETYLNTHFVKDKKEGEDC